MVTSTALPGSDPADALWARTAPPGPATGPLEGDRRADLVVVGGGYTGLSCALHAAGRGIDTVLLEAGAPGFGASGRNSGEVVPGWSKHSPDEIVARFGRERGEAMNAFVRESAALVFELIARHAIECDAVERGWLMPASTPRRLALARAKHDQWARRGADVALLDRAETEALTGSSHYIGAWLHRGGGTIQPLGYARGLARAAIEAGAALYSSSPATGIERTADGWRVMTPRGAVHAGQVVLATNAYSGALWPALARSLIPLRLFQLATAPLGDNLSRSVLPQGQGISDARRQLWAFRKDREGRLITGVAPLSVRVSQDTMHRMAARHLAAVFPQIGEPRFEFHWNGLVAVTLDRLPRFVELAPGLHAGFGYSGRGIALSTGMGRLLAARAAGAHADELPLAITRPRPLPLRDLLVPLARVRAWWWRRLDALEDRMAGRPRD